MEGAAEGLPRRQHVRIALFWGQSVCVAGLALPVCFRVARAVPRGCTSKDWTDWIRLRGYGGKGSRHGGLSMERY